MKKLLHTKIAGFTLIEALIAALVVGVGMLGLAKLQGEFFLAGAESRMRTQALNLAQEKIEEFRNFANQETYNVFTGGENTDTETIMAGGNANFTRSWEISDCPDSAGVDVNCKQIDVTVDWTDSKGAAQQVQLSSYIAQADPVKSGIVMAAATTTSSTASTGSTNSTSSSTTTSTTATSTSSSTSPTTSTTSSTSPVTSTTLPTGSCTCNYKNATSYTVGGLSSACCTVAICQAADPFGSRNNSSWSASCINTTTTTTASTTTTTPSTTTTTPSTTTTTASTTTSTPPTTTTTPSTTTTTPSTTTTTASTTTSTPPTTTTTPSTTTTTPSTTTTTTLSSCTKTITGSITKNSGGSSAKTRTVIAGGVSCSLSGNTNNANYTCSNVTATCGTAVSVTCSTNCSPASSVVTLSAPTGGSITGPSFTSP